MKSILFVAIFFFNFCNAQQKFEKPSKPKQELNDIKPVKNLKKGHFILNLGKLKQNEDDLYCWEIDGKYKVIDGKITLYGSSIARGDNASVTERLYAEGEFLQGKYQGIWKFYDDKRNIIKEEKWNNGKLIYRKEYDFNKCDNLEEYIFASDVNLSKYNSVAQFKKDFSLKSGKLTCKDGIIKSMRLIFRDETTIQFISINKGLIAEHEIQIINDPIPSGKSYYYDKEGNIKRISEVKNELLNGNGHYINYYYPKNIQSSGIKTAPILKSEGEIKNNFKSGEWIYYNREGKIDSTKTYSVKDSVDIRFPNCIFNKKESCY